MADPVPYRILSIDGGGIRGLIPARIVEYLEDRAGRPAAQLFDMIAGTSTGGLLALGFSHPDAQGQPSFSGKDAVALYRDKGPRIFDEPFFRSEWVQPKYPADGLEAALQEVFGDSMLAEALTGVLVTTYAMDVPPPPQPDAQPKPQAFFFKSWRAKHGNRTGNQRPEDRNFRMRDAARATSAAPTYFAPAEIESQSGRRYLCCDGGVFANNPAMCALASSRELYAGVPAAERPEIYVVSLGTGKQEQVIPADNTFGWGRLGWFPDVLEVMFDGVADTVAYQIAREVRRHHRFQTNLTPYPDGYPVQAFDDASPDNTAALIRKADDLIEAQRPALDRIAEELRGWAGKPPTAGPDAGGDGDSERGPPIA